MGDVYGVNRTLKRTGTANTIEPEVNGGVVKWIYETYVAEALAAGSVIKLFSQDLPAEARIVDWMIDHDALQADSDVTLAFGTNASAAALMAATTCAAANKLALLDDGAAGSLGYELSAGTGQILQLTTSSPGGDSAATGTIRVGVAYVTKG